MSRADQGTRASSSFAVTERVSHGPRGWSMVTVVTVDAQDDGGQVVAKLAAGVAHDRGLERGRGLVCGGGRARDERTHDAVGVEEPTVPPGPDHAVAEQDDGVAG